MYKLRKDIDVFKRPFYCNVGVWHLPRPTLRDKRLKDSDGMVIPIIHVDTGRG